MGKAWQWIARFIIRQRVPILLVVIAATVFMGFNAQTELIHSFLRVVPPDDPDLIAFNQFKAEFGESGNVLVVGIEGDVFQKDFLNGVYELTGELEELPYVESVLSIPNLPTLEKNSEEKKFDLVPLMPGLLATEADADSMEKKIEDLPFYQGLLLNEAHNATALAINLNEDSMNTAQKVPIVDKVVELSDAKAAKINAKTHYAGISFLRAYNAKHVPREMIIFLIMAIVITALVLLFFFRSFFAVVFPLLVIGIVIIWSLGILGLLDYQISMMTAIIPPLITVIGIPNSVYLLTKYHFEYKRTGNKIKSLVLVIRKIGIVTVMTNATTAIGFLVLAFTDIQILREFGITAGLSVITTFFISLLLIPIFFSYLPPPGTRQMKHTDTKILNSVIRFIDTSVHKRRTVIYIVSIVILIFSIVGLTMVDPVSFISDDIPVEVQNDMHFLDENFGGAMPFEMCINTHQPNGALKRKYLKKVQRLTDQLDTIPELSRPLSVLDFVKYGRQAYFGGYADEYQMPLKRELDNIQLYAKKGLESTDGLGSLKLVDSTGQKIRISMNIKDVGSREMGRVADIIQKAADSTFLDHQEPEDLVHGESYKVYGPDSFRVKYGKETLRPGDVFEADTNVAAYTAVGGTGTGIIDYSDRALVTGTTRIWIKGNSTLIGNLLQSLLIAFGVIAILMAVLFGNIKMVLASLVPNTLPLLFTAGVMGYLGIPLKPSTAMVFSVAFGIAVDDSIHYLARFRQARKSGDDVNSAVSNSFKDTGLSMIYTSIILFFGFVIFSWSSFSTRAMGQLTSPTLMIALFANLLLLPALLISLNPSSRPLKGSGIIDYEDELNEDDSEENDEIITSENGNGNTEPDTEKIR